MQIIEYNDKYFEDATDLLVELEEYIVSIDKDNLDQVGENYRKNILSVDLEEVNNNEGICYLAIDENDKAIGLIMGIIIKYDEDDYLDYKCPKSGRITELIVTNKVRANGVGKMLIDKMEEYFKKKNCKYILIDVFGYNDNAIKFYSKKNYHTRMLDMIKKINN